eukprot:2594552-Rhodomonas_salina.1
MADEELNEEDLDIEIDEDEEDIYHHTASAQKQNGSHGAGTAKESHDVELVVEEQVQMACENVQNGVLQDNGDELNEEELDIELEDDDMTMDAEPRNGEAHQTQPAASTNGHPVPEESVHVPSPSGE